MLSELIRRMLSRIDHGGLANPLLSYRNSSLVGSMFGAVNP